jgi:Domain of unknown function (DUF4864)
MRHLLVAVVVFFVSLMPVQAQEEGIQAVISAQLQAFLRDDFKTAYSYAAPDMRRIFPTQDRFEAMVRGGYPMVHRPASYKFTGLEKRNGRYLQRVLLQDQSGRFFVAEYGMLETADGWLISSVQILNADAVGA